MSSGTDVSTSPGGRPISLTEVPPEVRSEVLLRGRQRVRIEHRGEYYQLSVTRHGKLLLTK